MNDNSKKYSLIKIDGMVSNENNVGFTKEEADSFTDDFILFIESKKLFFGGGLGGFTKEEEDKM